MHAIFSLLALAASCVLAEPSKLCGSHPYVASQYTCFDGFLCPVVGGEKSLKCGDAACYLPEAYACVNGTLGQHRPVDGPFEVRGLNSVAAINGKRLNACGLRFWLNNEIDGSGTGYYCPDYAARTGVCAGVRNTTVFWGSSSLAVYVPGGQQYYVGPDGALGFTQGHSAAYPPGSGFGVAAYNHGYFTFTNSDGWLACPATGGCAGRAGYQVFAVRPGHHYNETCVGLNLGTHTLPNGTIGAFQYT